MKKERDKILTKLLNQYKNKSLRKIIDRNLYNMYWEERNKGEESVVLAKRGKNSIYLDSGTVVTEYDNKHYAVNDGSHGFVAVSKEKIKQLTAYMKRLALWSAMTITMAASAYATVKIDPNFIPKDFNIMQASALTKEISNDNYENVEIPEIVVINELDKTPAVSVKPDAIKNNETLDEKIAENTDVVEEKILPKVKVENIEFNEDTMIPLENINDINLNNVYTNYPYTDGLEPIVLNRAGVNEMKDAESLLIMCQNGDICAMCKVPNEDRVELTYLYNDEGKKLTGKDILEINKTQDETR